jgi:hypothetical protein
MREVLRTNDPVALSFAVVLLRDSGIEAVVLDEHSSVMEGSIGAIQRRLMVLPEDLAAARNRLREAGLAQP